MTETTPLVALERPFYLVDLPTLTAKYDALLAAFCRRFPSVDIGLSYKTAYIPLALKHLHARGAFAEVVSEVEYELSTRLAVPGERVIFNGPGKSRHGIGRALDRGSLVNLDSLAEVEHVLAWRNSNPTKHARVGLRINLTLPDVGGKPSRFGLEVNAGQVEVAVSKLRAAEIELSCLHAHLTSQTRKATYYGDVARTLCAAMARAGLRHIPVLDVGGGFGSSPANFRLYDFPSFEQYADAIAEAFQEAGVSCDTLVIEPGIALFGDAVSLYATVLATKEIAGRTLCVLDASVQTVKPTKHGHILPTTAFDSTLSPKAGVAREVDLVGYTCLEDDVIARGAKLPALVPGDVLRIENVGAYTFVFKPQFIRGMPAFYLWDGTTATRARRADSFEDMFGAYDF